MTITAAQLRSLVQAVRRKTDDPVRAIGVQCRDGWAGDDDLDIDQERWSVRFVRSSLQARRALVRAETPLLLLTPLRDDELGSEVLARFPFPRLEEVRPWQAVRDLFDAQRLDPRVVQNPWMADELLNVAPADGFAPVRGSVLDLDTVWGVLLGELGIATARPGIDDLLAASLTGELQRRWSDARPPMRTGAIKRFGETVGPTGPHVAACLDAGDGGDLVAIGLVIDLLSSPDADASDVIAARTRLESMGVGPDDWSSITAWGEAAARWCRGAIERDAASLDAVLDRAERLVDDVRASGIAGKSSILKSGLTARRAELAACLDRLVQDPKAREPQDAVERAWESLQAHAVFQHASVYTSARERAAMAVRLARWLGTTADTSGALASLAARYRDDSAWADRARHAMLAGELDAELTPAFTALAERATDRREQENRAFAERLATATAGGESLGDVLLLERVLHDVIAPLVERAKKVLLIVMDGMSQAVFQALGEHLDGRPTLDRQIVADRTAWPAVITPMPSVTQVCRASLLSGTIACGAQTVERDGLESVADRYDWRGRARKQPILFHKGDLQDAGGALKAAVRKSIESGTRVVAAVVNVVDDHLAKGDQLEPDWSLSSVPVLEALVSQAELEQRAIVLVADHGHVRDVGAMEKLGSDERPERWRSDELEPREGELVVRGERVVLPQPGGPLVALWSERLRYVAAKGGYHGGASPQEVVAPLAVFVPTNAGQLAGWCSEVVVPPPWWEGSVGEVAHRTKAPSKSRPTKVPTKRPKTVQPPDLFEPAPVETPTTDQETTWIDELLASELYKAQRAVAGRTPPAAEEVRRILVEIDGAGGTLTVEALRARVRVPRLRLRGQLTALGRILNVEGFPALEIDASSQTVRVDQQLIRTQFQLDEGEAP